MEKILEGVLATSQGVGRGQVLFDEESGLILAVGNLGHPREKVDYFYSDDCLVFAGMGDVHIHAREDVSGKHLYKEDYATASRAAVNGGVTHACDMPNNPIPPIDDESWKEKFKLTEKSSIPLLPYAGIGPETRPLSFQVPYKAYMGPSVGELFFRTQRELDETLVHYSGQYVSFHCEDPEILESSKGEATHLLRRPLRAEVLATEHALAMIKKHGLKGKLCHYSAGEGLNLVRKARTEGLEVEIEVTPQHLYFCDEELPNEKRYSYQMNPPIRPKSDREAMLEALRNGELTYLATDHAPHTKEEKEKGTSGLTGLDTYGSFVTWLLIEKDIDPKTIALVCCENPGTFISRFLPAMAQVRQEFAELGLGPGFLREGHTASFTVLDLKSESLVTEESLLYQGGSFTLFGRYFSWFCKREIHSRKAVLSQRKTLCNLFIDVRSCKLSLTECVRFNVRTLRQYYTYQRKEP